MSDQNVRFDNARCNHINHKRAISHSTDFCLDLRYIMDEFYCSCKFLLISNTMCQFVKLYRFLVCTVPVFKLSACDQ